MDPEYEHRFVRHVGDLQISIVAADVDGGRQAHAQIVSGDLAVILPLAHLEDLSRLLDEVDDESGSASSEFFTLKRLGGSVVIQAREGVQAVVMLSSDGGETRLREAITASCESVRSLLD